MIEKITTSLHSGYANDGRIELAPYTSDINFEKGVPATPTMYFQFVQGCGYEVYHLTATEARELSQKLLIAAAEAETEAIEHNAKLAR